MKLTLAKGTQSRWEDDEITGENLTLGSFDQFIVFDFVALHRGRLFCHVRTTHSQFRPINDFKTHFQLQKPTLTKAV